MAQETRIVKGGFRSTLALVLSIVALVISLISYGRTGGQLDLNAQMQELRSTVSTVRKETAGQIDRMRQETANALERLSESLKTGEGK